MIEALEQLVGSWARLYGESSLVSSVVVFLHLAGVVWGGGRAIAADTLVLRSPGPDQFRERPGVDFLATSHRQVTLGLVVIATAGVLMLLADREHFLGATLFWVKMATVAALLVNGAVLTRLHRLLGRDERPEGHWSLLRTTSRLSLVLWLAVLALGVGLGG